MLALRRWVATAGRECPRRAVAAFSTGDTDRAPDEGGAGLLVPEARRRFIVGLGNVGPSFVGTRHNVGFEACRWFVEHQLARMVELNAGHQLTERVARTAPLGMWDTAANAAMRRKPEAPPPPPKLTFDAVINGELVEAACQFGMPPRRAPAIDADGQTIAVPVGDEYDALDRAAQRRRNKTYDEGVPVPSARLAVVLPHTMMNRSGRCIASFMERCNVAPARKRGGSKGATAALDAPAIGPELLVVYDDFLLPFGMISFKPGDAGGGGEISAGSHNGLSDVAKQCGKFNCAVHRLRIGVGKRPDGVADVTKLPKVFAGAGGSEVATAGRALASFVLGKFSGEEAARLPLVLDAVGELIRVYVHRGLGAAATAANSRDFIFTPLVFGEAGGSRPASAAPGKPPEAKSRRARGRGRGPS